MNIEGIPRSAQLQPILKLEIPAFKSGNSFQIY